MFRWPLSQGPVRNRRSRLLVTVGGTIAKYNPDEQDDSGARHQLITVTVTEIAESSGTVALSAGDSVFIAIRIGDGAGISEPIVNLAVGAPIVVKGVFISADDAYAQEDGSRFAVIHFTHRPLGWVKYGGRLYR